MFMVSSPIVALVFYVVCLWPGFFAYLATPLLCIYLTPVRFQPIWMLCGKIYVGALIIFLTFVSSIIRACLESLSIGCGVYMRRKLMVAGFDVHLVVYLMVLSLRDVRRFGVSSSWIPLGIAVVAVWFKSWGIVSLIMNDDSKVMYSVILAMNLASLLAIPVALVTEASRLSDVPDALADVVNQTAEAMLPTVEMNVILTWILRRMYNIIKWMSRHTPGGLDGAAAATAPQAVTTTTRSTNSNCHSSTNGCRQSSVSSLHHRSTSSSW